MKRLSCIFALQTFFILTIYTLVCHGESTTLRFAFQDRIGSVIPITAEYHGFFTKAGLDVNTFRFNSGPACSEALFSGAADIGAMGDTTAVIITARSDRFVIIASHATGENRHRIMVKADSPARTIRDLKGKTLAVKMGTSTYGGLLSIFSKNGISASGVNLTDLTPPIMTEALLAGSINAFAASEPTPSLAEEKGARELATLGGLGNIYPILIVANRSWARTHPDIVRSFLTALKKAGNYANAHMTETMNLMASETGLTPKTTEQAMTHHQYRLRLDPEILDSLSQTAQFLKSQGIITTIPEVSVMSDKTYFQ